jgi:tetratricopeptide (TPR) repeat protein
LEPGYLAALNNRGVALLALRQPLEAIASYETALALDPDFAEAIYNRGDALRELRRFAEALRDYERAIALRPTYAEAFNNRGNTLQELGRPLDALTSYDQALALRPGYIEAMENKGILLGEFGVLDAARQALQSVIAVAPGRARAHYHLARLKRMTRADPQLKILEGLARNLGALSTKDAIDVGFALGKAYDDIGEYERAFEAYAKANALKRAGLAYDEAQALARLAEIAKTFSPSAIHAHRGMGDDSPAPIFIFGMPRSGSTLIEQILARHPEVTPLGEVDDFEQAIFFARDDKGCKVRFPQDFPSISGNELRGIAERYLSRIGAGDEPGKRLTDKNPSNFLFAGLIHLALPNARLIHTRRDPSDTCWSCFTQRFADYGSLPSAYDLGEIGRFYRGYQKLMEHWLSVLPEGAILTVDYESVVADLEGQARRILSFCELEWNDCCLEFHEARRQVRTASSGQVNQPLHRNAIGRWRPYERLLVPLTRELFQPAPEDFCEAQAAASRQ